MQVQVVERAQQVAVQEQEIARREKELEARVRKPAEAERYRLERLAEAEKYRPLPDPAPGPLMLIVRKGALATNRFSSVPRAQLIMQAEAEAESVRVS